MAAEHLQTLNLTSLLYLNLGDGSRAPLNSKLDKSPVPKPEELDPKLFMQLPRASIWYATKNFIKIFPWVFDFQNEAVTPPPSSSLEKRFKKKFQKEFDPVPNLIISAFPLLDRIHCFRLVRITHLICRHIKIKFNNYCTLLNHRGKVFCLFWTEEMNEVSVKSFEEVGLAELHFKSRQKLLSEVVLELKVDNLHGRSGARRTTIISNSPEELFNALRTWLKELL